MLILLLAFLNALKKLWIIVWLHGVLSPQRCLRLLLRRKIDHNEERDLLGHEDPALLGERSERCLRAEWNVDQFNRPLNFQEFIVDVLRLRTILNVLDHIFYLLIDELLDLVIVELILHPARTC